MSIDPRAIVDPSARLGEGVEIGPWTVVGPDVEIGDRCVIASHVVLKGPTRLGPENQILQFATVGESTPALAWQGQHTTLEVGARNVFREGVTIHRGMLEGASTRIGNDNLFMAYVHVGHDCEIGDHVIMANNASVSGHVTVGDYANFGGYSGVAQHRSVGAYTHIAAMSLVLKDVPAFVTVGGHPARAIGLNAEGMRRRQLTPEVTRNIRHAWKQLYRRGLSVEDALGSLREQAAECAYTKVFVDSVRSSDWGIARPRGRIADDSSPEAS